ncbi:hypothetical protein MRB53_004593 [Persea americana]|uniref:Uncharacterized protein n=1 Tax=Persea americana TaxID=3435 RepID=A0ACC2MBN4_PERAE|nr:hypothetical protein MRB53_004593 [Persea americana]
MGLCRWVWPRWRWGCADGFGLGADGTPQLRREVEGGGHSQQRRGGKSASRDEDRGDSPLHARKSRPKTLRSRSLDSRGAIKISAVTPSKSKDNSDSLVEGTASNMHAFDDNRVSEVTPIMLLMKLIYVQC